ncbi:MAG TPA: copper homeostasis membrane protein CopD [Asticcacaulis sp.]|nr:copper homeostasis membrane protein CopD [Asticcacaulis sp.]
MDWTSLIMADLARLLQYAGAVILFGTALFNLISLPRSGEASASRQDWPGPLFLGASVALLCGAVGSLLAQSATMNGLALSKLDWPAVRIVLFDTRWGHAIALRIALGLAASLLALRRPRHSDFIIQSMLGLIALASFAFTGHGSADDGLSGDIHLVNDMIHSVAAGVWLGALVGFYALLRAPKTSDEPHRSAVARALTDFSATGTLMVALLVATGLINSGFLIGLAGLPGLLTSAYGVLLAAKLVLFAGMLALAARNRFRLTPALHNASDPQAQAAAISALRRSVTAETFAGLIILLLVAIFGMLEPPGAS